MTSRIALALVVHNHQPVGNFGWVIEDVFRSAYEPMLAALERHPRVRVGLHYTGPLFEWLEAEQPQAVERLAALADRGQVEILGGAWTEPILATLPVADRVAQLRRMGDELERRFGRRPRGAWLAERVWEPSLPADLVRGGYDWTILDDNHLRSASVAEGDMWSAFTTDDQGERLTVFGTEQGLRYRIPFGPVEDLIDYLREVNSCPEMQVMCCGGIYKRAEGLADEIGADLYAPDAMDAVAVAHSNPQKRATVDQQTVGRMRRIRRAQARRGQQTTKRVAPTTVDLF